MSATTIGLRELLSCCCDAADRACRVIRAVHKTRVEGGDAALGAALKDVTCERSWATIADMRAQHVIVHALTRDFPGVTIVGEEDEADALAAGHDAVSESDAPLRRDHPSVAQITAPARWETVDMRDVTIFIDPVDGTREYVEGRVHNSCCLVGIALRGEAIAGVVGMPFWRVDPATDALQAFDGLAEDAGSVTVCGIVDGPGGLGGLPAGEVTRAAAEKARRTAPGAVLRLAASAEGSATSTMGAARAALCEAAPGWEAPFELVSTPGAANKVLAVILGRCDGALMNLKCSLWDSCATEAVLVASGGVLTDFFGGRIDHRRSNPLGLGNKYGMLASAPGMDHARLYKRLSATPAVLAILEPTGLTRFAPDGAPVDAGVASDIARTIRGAPLTCDVLSAALGTRVAAFCAPEGSAVRYKMAECCRLWLRYDEAADAGPRSVFVKRSVMRDLKHARAKVTTVPHKLARDVRSYAVETAFLRSQAIARLAAAPGGPSQPPGAFYLAKALHSEAHVEAASLVDSSFCVVLQDFCQLDGWEQRGFVTPEELRAALRCLARFHAFFWNGRVGCEAPDATNAVQSELNEAVWDSGCYWSPKRQAADQIDKLAARFEAHGYATTFADLVAARGGDPARLAAIPAGLTAVARDVARASHLYLDNTTTGAAAPFTNAGGPPPSADGVEVQSDRSRGHPQRTLLHGDLKAANLFFRPRRSANNSGDAAADAVEPGFIDFQWTGWGLGAVDIAYMFCAAAGPECFDLTPDAAAETSFLRVYHEALCAGLVEFGAAANVAAAEALQSFATLEAQYRAALLDHSVTVFSYLWNDIKASPATLADRGKKFPLTANAVNKSPECAAWLLGRVAQLLDARGTK